MHKASNFQHAETDIKARQAAAYIVSQRLEHWEKPLVKNFKPFVPHPELHKKTYFNAIEKLLVTPQPQPKDENEIDPKTWGSAMILENSIKHPPVSYNQMGKHNGDREWYDNYIEPQNMIVKKTRQASEYGMPGQN